MAIQELDLEIRHRSGKSNVVADALSRNPVLEESDIFQIEVGGDSHAPPSDTPLSNSEIGQLQREDEELFHILAYLEEGHLPAEEKLAHRLIKEKFHYEVVDGILRYVTNEASGQLRVAVPRSLRGTLIQESQDGKFSGHFAEKKIYVTLRKKYWWPGMRADVKRYCHCCLPCISRKGPGHAIHPPLQSIPVGGPFHRVGVDFLQLPQSYNGNCYAIVFMDYFTKWPEVFAVPDQQVSIVARLLVEEVIARHGVPEYLLSDRGANFLSDLVQEVYKLVGTTKINTSGYHPQCDGLVEKFNSTLINMIAKSTENYGRDWDQHLPYLLFTYRVAVQDSTLESPFYLMYGRDARIPTQTSLEQPRTPYQVDISDYRSELVAHLSDAWALAHDHIKQAQSRQKHQYDKP